MKRAFAIAIAVFAFSAGCSEYNREAIDSNNQGMGLLRANRYADAREKFQRAAEEDRRYDQPLYNLALSYIRQNDWANAIDALQRAISRNANNAEYHYQLGNAHYKIATDPRNEDSSQNGAHFEQARAAFQAAIQRNRNLYLAHYHLGRIAEALDEPQQALRHYTDTLTVAPRHYMSYVRLGNLYFKHRQFDQGAQVIRSGLQIAPEGANERGQMHNVLGLILEAQNQKLQAAESFLAAVREDPQLVQAYYSVGTLYAEMPDRREQAILYLDRFVSAQGGGNQDYLQDAQTRLTALRNPAVAPQ